MGISGIPMLSLMAPDGVGIVALVHLPRRIRPTRAKGVSLTAHSSATTILCQPSQTSTHGFLVFPGDTTARQSNDEDNCSGHISTVILRGERWSVLYESFLTAGWVKTRPHWCDSLCRCPGRYLLVGNDCAVIRVPTATL